MRSRRITMWAAFLAILLTIDHLVFASLSVIGGSSGVSPPPFQDYCFWGATSSIERAYQFTVISGGPYIVEELEIAVYHYEGMSGSTAYFSINVDNNGEPGDALAAVEMTGIPTSPQIVSTTFTEEVILNGDTSYWLVGGTHQQQINWNCADYVLGTAAYRVNQGAWTILASSHLAAYAILGSPVPEPASVILLGLGGILMRKRR